MRSRIWVLTLLIGCGSDDALPAADRAMISDSMASISRDALAIAQIERTFSPSFAFQAGPDGDISQVSADALAAAKTAIASRLGASCVTATDLPSSPDNPTDRTTRFVLGNCAFEGESFTGTVTSHWVMLDGCLQADHVTDGLLIGAAPVAIGMTVSGCVTDQTESRARALSLTSPEIQITGNWAESYDKVASCATRSGQATTTFAGTGGIDRRETGLTWCGPADELPLLSVAALDGGSVELERLGRRVVARFTGDGELDVLTSAGERLSTPAD